MASNPDGSGPPSHAYSAMSKSWFGSRVPKKVGFAGSNAGVTLMPTACRFWAKIAALVARRWLPAVVFQRNSAFRPAQVQMSLLSWFFVVGFQDAGPPVQPCALRSAMALAGLKFHLLNCGTALTPSSQSALFSGFRLGAIWL